MCGEINFISLFRVKSILLLCSVKTHEPRHKDSNKELTCDLLEDGK